MIVREPLQCNSSRVLARNFVVSLLRCSEIPKLLTIYGRQIYVLLYRSRRQLLRPRQHRSATSNSFTLGRLFSNVYSKSPPSTPYIVVYFCTIREQTMSTHGMIDYRCPSHGTYNTSARVSVGIPIKGIGFHPHSGHDDIDTVVIGSEIRWIHSPKKMRREIGKMYPLTVSAEEVQK